MSPRARQAPAGEPDEASFGTVVENLLDVYGWRWFHAPDNRPVTARSGRRYVQRVRPGFPDYIALRGPELLVIELKTARGRLGPGQAEWLEAWRTFAAAIDDLELAEPINLSRELGKLRRGEVDPSGPVVEVHLWRPADLEAINDRLSRGRNRLSHAG